MKPSFDQDLQKTITTRKKNDRLRKTLRKIGIILGIILIILTALARLGKWMYQRDQMQYQEQIVAEQFSTKVGLFAMSNEFNKHCPLLMSEYFELKSTSVIEPKTLVFNLKMLGDESTYSDEALFKLLVSMDLKDEISSEEYRELREASVTFLYKFYERDGNFFTEIEMTQENYK